MTEEWRERAKCKGLDTDTFFPTQGDLAGVKAAKAICAGCPVRRECLDDAIVFEVRWGIPAIGIRGGLSGKERRQIRWPNAA